MLNEISQANLVIAPLWRRFVALNLDTVIFLLLVTLPVSIAFGVTPLTSEASDSGLYMLALYGIGTLVPFGFLVVASATPGKMLMGLYVGTTTGLRISPRQAIFRLLVMALFFVDVLFPAAIGITLLLTLVSILMALFDPQRRALHDRLASTLVLAGKPPPAHRADLVLPRT